jgi:hypothetical protein
MNIVTTSFGFSRYIPEMKKYSFITKYPQRQWQHIQKAFESLYPPPSLKTLNFKVNDITIDTPARPMTIKFTKRAIRDLQIDNGVDLGAKLFNELKEGK